MCKASALPTGLWLWPLPCILFLVTNLAECRSNDSHLRERNWGNRLKGNIPGKGTDVLGSTPSGSSSLRLSGRLVLFAANGTIVLKTFVQGDSPYPRSCAATCNLWARLCASGFGCLCQRRCYDRLSGVQHLRKLQIAHTQAPRVHLVSY